MTKESFEKEANDILKYSSENFEQVALFNLQASSRLKSLLDSIDPIEDKKTKVHLKDSINALENMYNTTIDLWNTIDFYLQKAINAKK